MRVTFLAKRGLGCWNASPNTQLLAWIQFSNLCYVDQKHGHSKELSPKDEEQGFVMAASKADLA